MVRPMCTKFGIYHLLRTRKENMVSKSLHSEFKMAAGRHFKIHTNLNIFRTICQILTKFGMELRPDTAQTPDSHFSKPKMAADEKLKFTKN